jgi:AcrR family transcriptional regulator
VPRVGLTTDAVVDAALAILDETGAEPTLAAVAGRTGVATPSLYKHVRSLAELHRLVSLRVTEEFAGVLGDAVMGRSADDAVAALMRGWRRYVVERPHRYAIMPVDPLHDPELAVPGERIMFAVLAVLRSYGLDGDEAVHATRRMRAAAHGFASLESAGGFGLPEDVDRSYDQLIAMVIGSLRARSDGMSL